MHNYHSANGVFPMAASKNCNSDPASSCPGYADWRGWSTLATSLPFTEQVNLFNAINFNGSSGNRVGDVVSLVGSLPLYSEAEAPSSAPEIRHDVGMGKLKRLQDIYRFPHFVPRAEVRGIFGDPYAVVITLRRRQKKRAAVCAGGPVALSTISGCGASGTSRAAIDGSTSNSRYVGSIALGVEVIA